MRHLKTTTRQYPKTTTQEAYAAFITARQAQNVTPATLEYYRGKLLPFIGWCMENGAGDPAAIRADHIRRFIVSLQQRNLAPRTVHGHARAIKAFVRFCEQDAYIPEAPKFAMPKMPKDILPAFTPSDIARLLDACDCDRDRLIVSFLLDSGLRASEFVALNSDDINTNTGAVTVRNGKGNKARIVFLGAKTRRELVKYWRDNGRLGPGLPVWTSLTTKERLTGDGLRQILQRLGQRAGVAHCSPHAFRRSFALFCLRSGMDIHTLAALMGHSDVMVLRHYLALNTNDLERAHAQHSPVDNMTRRGQK